MGTSAVWSARVLVRGRFVFMHLNGADREGAIRV